MGLRDWWSWWNGEGATPNANPGSSVGPGFSPGAPDGVEVLTPEPAVQQRMAAIVPSPWDGWVPGWSSPLWSNMGGNFDVTVDTAWVALDLNASVTSSMPPYMMRGGQVLSPRSWLTNPDPSIYTSWAEFAKQLMWDYQLGEAFVLPMARTADNLPFRFRVIPPHLINVEMSDGRRVYNLGVLDITDDVLHIRYKSRTDTARGMGPLESGRNRLIAAGLLARYASEIAEGGGVPKYVLEVDQRLNKAQADELLEQWWASRMANIGQPWKPAVLSGGAKARPLQLSPEQMTLTELSKWNESRIAVLLGVPPVLLGLPSGGDSMTYKNVDSLFDYHHRAGIKPKVTMVMQALSGWALPRGQIVELNHDEYTRPGLLERATADEKFIAMGALTSEQVATMERFAGDAAVESLTGIGGS